MASVSELLPASYHDAWRDMKAFAHDEYWFPGGRGSLKSTAAALRIVTALVRDPQANAVCYRKVKAGLESSVYNEIVKTIDRLGWTEHFTFKTSPLLIVYNPTGQRVMFAGLDDPGKSKGITVAHGYIQLVWFEEFDQYDGMDEINNVIQSVGRGGPKFQMIATYNPPVTNAAWVNVEVARPSARRLVTKTDYRAVNPAWLGPAFLRLVEEMKERDPKRYAHDYLGEVTGTGGEIFRNVEVREITAEERAEMRSLRWGMDYGVCDPTVVVCTNYAPNTRTLYILDEWGKSDALVSDVAAAMSARHLENVPVIADPGGGGKGLIRELHARGFRLVREAYKPGGSVDAGINWMRDLSKIVIDPKTCPESAREFTMYEYARLRDGTYRSEYPDKENHRIDAVRYSTEENIFAGKRSRLLI